jgi:sec-independent protein translocase protein TatB
MLLVGLLFLVIFGPDKLPDVARDIGRFVNEARRSVEEFKDGFVSEDEAGRKPAKTGDPEVNRELERNLPREEAAVVIRTDPRNEQHQQ